MTLIRDLLNLPDHVRRGDFVLKLSEGVERAEETLRTYVVTPQLVGCFDQALGLIQSALSARTSKGCYLHGSFGSGKSHFMAVLDLMLQGNVQARSIPELAGVIAKHNAWANGKRFLQVPIHMIGGESMEQKVLGSYVECVRSLHPEAPTPAVFRADEILADARGLRKSLGDEAFFARLSENPQEDMDSQVVVTAGWGEIEAGWDAERFAAACAEPPGGKDRNELVSRLVDTFFSAVRNSGEYIDLDHGLAVVSQHAAGLDYDGVILFLDELILWLASHSADMSFLTREGQKLAKLVEAQAANRPIPLVSFVARQRDLKDLVGDNVTGADYTSFTDVLGWWEARFATIKLEDRNLPAIAEKRVLVPVSADAKQAIDGAFAQTARTRKDVLDVLLTHQHTQESFRRIYPFTPAFMDMLVEMSFLLQRDRTALKVMLQLLIDQRETLVLGDVIPVGDLFDYIAEGDEAISDDIRRNFDSAKRLYEGKFRPLLEREHGVSVDSLGRLLAGEKDPLLERLRNDDRLVKTLLLAALAPNLESFRNLTANRLAALNHGTIRSPIPGQEGRVVLGKCKKWAAEIGQLKIGEDPVNPSMAVHLTGVDTESIIEAARTFDNKGNRARMIKRLLFQQLGIEGLDEMIVVHPFRWRGTKRECQVIFGNVRELAEESLVSRSENWQVVIDLPFDEPEHGPADDKAKMAEILRKHPEGTRTLVLLPSFLGRRAQQDLGTLVILDNLLRGANLHSHASRLTEAERQDARSILDNQRSQLERHLIGVLECAYGISSEHAEAIDTSHELEPAEHFQTLDPAFQVRAPASADFRQALESLLGQALEYQYPAHPRFSDDAKLSVAVLKRVCAEIERAAQAEGGRVLVDKAQRRELELVVEPLRLGEMGETHFVLGHEWQNRFQRQEAKTGETLTVQRLRGWLDQPEVMGLPREVEDLVIMTFAVQSNYTFLFHGGAIEPTVGNLPDEAELKIMDLPSDQDWQIAAKRAGEIFGVPGSPLLNAANVAKLAAGVRKVAAENQEAGFELRKALGDCLSRLELDRNNDRYRAAVAAERALQAAAEKNDGGLVRALAALPDEVPFAATGTSLRKSRNVYDALGRFDWQLVATLTNLPPRFLAQGAQLKNRLVDAVVAYEHAIALAPVLVSIQDRTMALVNEALADSRQGGGSGGGDGSGEGKPAPKRDITGKDIPRTIPQPAILAVRGCLGSDFDDAVAHYGNNHEGLARNRRLVAELKMLYGRSQVEGDGLPDGLPHDRQVEILEVHHIRPLGDGGEDAWANMVVVTPTLHALLHADPASALDLAKKKAVIFGVPFLLRVELSHLQVREAQG